MRVLNKSDIYESFSGFGRIGKDRLQCDEQGPFFANGEADCILLEYPSKVERFPFFARTLASIGYEEPHFDSALLWITEWGVWNPRDEGIGYQTVEMMNRAAGQPASFEAAPGHQFRADEFTSAVAMLMQPILFGWDAFYLPLWAYGVEEFFLYISHDSVAYIVTRTEEFYGKAFSILQDLNLNPKPAGAGKTAFFCRVSNQAANG